MVVKNPEKKYGRLFLAEGQNRRVLVPLLGGSSIPVSTKSATMAIVSPVTGVVGPLPNGLFMAYNGGY